jgi:hypothetical protein
MNLKNKSLSRCVLSTVCFLALSFAARAAVTGDNHWDNQFGPVGTSDQLESVTAVGGKVYVGGLFQSAGNTRANYIAGYDGTNWFQLNNGVTNDVNITFVFALANDGSNVYAGGWFTNADNSGARYMARWDGTNFYPVAGGNPNSIVEVIKIFGTNVFVGGTFTTNGGVPVNRIARLDASGWHALGAGVAGAGVVAIDYDGTNVFAGGTFTNAGSVLATNVARWDGSTWNAMGNPFTGPVICVQKAGGILYVGGNFTNGAAGITNLAQWDGNTWSGVNANAAVRDLLWDGANLYAGGDFTNINGVAANRIAVLSGGVWSPLGVGIEGFGAGAVPGVYKMALDGSGNLFAAGNFNQAGGTGASHVARWDGANWYALGGTTSQGMTHFIGQGQGLYYDGTYLYAGGTFTEAGSNIVNGICRWNGANWSALGNVTIGQLPSAIARAFVSAGGTLYAGGGFTNIGGVPAGRIAAWDGANWSDIGDFDSGVRALGYDGTYVWAGGTFTNINGGFSPGVALFLPGAGWFTVGGISGSSQLVNAIAFDGSYMYIGGIFTAVNGVAANNIARFDGSSWSALGTGVNGTVGTILVANGQVYVGGNFTTAGGVTVNRVASWNGVGWSALGSGVTGTSSTSTVGALAFIGTNLYAGGNFTNASGVTASGVAGWNGASWFRLGSGLFTTLGTGGPGSSLSLAAVGNDLYVGGSFTSAGDKPATAISRWNDQLNFYPPPHPRLTRSVWLTNRQFQFRLTGTSGESYILQGSTNMTSWVSLLTNTMPLFDYTDTNANSFSNRFYRAVLGP